MTKAQEPKLPDTTIVLGMHSDDVLRVFVRGADHSLQQAAQIATRNGVDAASLTAIMADLTETFGWRNIVATPPVVPPTRELPRGRPRTEVTAAPVRGNPAKKGPNRNRPRRDSAQMQKQNDAVLAYVSDFDAEHAVGTGDVIANVCKQLDLGVASSDPNIRKNLDRLYKANEIARTSIIASGRRVHRWYGVAPAVPTATMLVDGTPVPVYAEAQSSVNLDGDTMS